MLNGRPDDKLEGIQKMISAGARVIEEAKPNYFLKVPLNVQGFLQKLIDIIFPSQKQKKFFLYDLWLPLYNLSKLRFWPKLGCQGRRKTIQ